MRLNQLSPRPGSHKARKRLGRGIGSGTGKTAGRGHKGQKSRSGVSIKGFEGGQMPLFRRLPKRGFVNIFRSRYAEVTLSHLQAALDAGKLDGTQLVDEVALAEAGVVRRVRDGVRLLARGELTTKIDISVSGATKAAISAVEKVGGKFTLAEPIKPAAKG